MSNNSERFRNTQLLSYVSSLNFKGVSSLLPLMLDCSYSLMGTTPLHSAVDVDSSAMCKLLLSSKKTSLDFAPGDLELPLVHALIEGKNSCAIFMLQMGADPRSRSRDGTPALFYTCCRKKEFPIFTAMVLRCPNAVLDLNPERGSSLLTAAKCKQHDILRVLCIPRTISHSLLRIPNIVGQNALMMSAIVGDKTGFDFLFKHIPFHVEDYAGSCALSYILKGNHVGMLHEVLKMKEVTTNSNYEHCLGNCLTIAVTNQMHLLAKHLSAAMNCVPDWLNFSSHSTIMHSLAAYGTEEMMDILQPHLKEGNWDIGDYQGNTPLMISMFYYNSYMTNLLLRTEKLDVDHKNVFGESAMTLSSLVRIPLPNK